MTATDGRVADERSPLMAADQRVDNNAVDAPDGLHGTHDTGLTGEHSKSGWYLFLLTLSIGG